MFEQVSPIIPIDILVGPVRMFMQVNLIRLVGSHGPWGDLVGQSE